jgi:hypothetical protein
VEDIYRLVCAAIANKQPIRGHLKGALPSVLPSRLGRSRLGQRRVLCLSIGWRERERLAPMGSPEDWRCVVFEKLSRVSY